ncbi:cell division protein FtsZ [Roseobacter sp. HKCCD9010]|uniref:cell division protein FtsZ n=1 Tax=unclassified Roseobacter TaxID=196798 RepID=UPI001491C783|nr:MULTISPECIES: cell division protein FtsZ [unclassified Roseobacter]MBF9049533.1 cell division protein FtsZ [Rhodobacterales bacterium HKCCD4356]NNV11533.1 cell division protein FtsZ [Roseobacter sp. HKCCD7357]NNV15717.1 cell division protein FtsZ [Roseobacter sp. HKCCD8768]NNV25177.1 cell division protein FtsZ [Roseobacter sp. HKCCD8192]NNV29434.1 cell division protein FtsZ [Roseobacter sp. HKCCD9061]
MTLNLTLPDDQPDLKPRITVFGVGGAGGNAVNNMIDQSLDGCEFVVANTDAQALAQSTATARIQMGARVTEGLGAGARPAVGASAAEESIEDIVDHLAGAHMAFITAGMGGGTGTGAAPIIAQAARELGVLTVGVVTKPFQFEGAKRMRQADEGIEQLQKVVDTLIIIPNQNLFRLANEKTTFTEAFAMADDVLYQGVKGVTDLMVRPGLINLDFADVRAVMNEMGKAMMGTGEADGESRAVQAAEKAIANPLLDEISLRGARGVLINITGGYDLTLFELDEAANRIREEVDPEANIIVGSTLDTSMEGKMRVSVVATGIDASEIHQDIPVATRRSLREPVAAPQADVEEDVVEPQIAADAAQPEPSLFAELEPAVEVAEDDVPAPAYQPQPEVATYAAPAAQAPAAAAEPEAEFVAPRPASASTPSPEALARLRAAINKDAPVAQAAADAESAGKPRFGINSLINRMTGHGEDQPTPIERRQPPVASRPAPEETQVDPEQERIEIPAFLRRQAN